ncbi:MAG: hypothetical protein J5938_04065 [Clostridia bacterium]|nr:hypothetical protein [Clostridia bacterium]
MGEGYIVISIIFAGLGILVGAALATLLSVWLVKRSNDVGDSSGTLYDFRANINLFDETNDIELSSQERSEQVFRKHLQEAMDAAAEREERRKKNPYEGVPRKFSQR